MPTLHPASQTRREAGTAVHSSACLCTADHPLHHERLTRSNLSRCSDSIETLRHAACVCQQTPILIIIESLLHARRACNGDHSPCICLPRRGTCW